MYILKATKTYTQAGCKIVINYLDKGKQSRLTIYGAATLDPSFIGYLFGKFEFTSGARRLKQDHKFPDQWIQTLVRESANYYLRHTEYVAKEVEVAADGELGIRLVIKELEK